MDEARIQRLMKNLDLTRQEAIDLLKDDKAIDQGKDLHPLTAEQEKVAKKMRQADRQPTAYKFSKRERKADNDKRFLMEALAWLLTSEEAQVGDNVLAEQVEITNPERQIDFVYNGRKFRIVLSAPRS